MISVGVSLCTIKTRVPTLSLIFILNLSDCQFVFWDRNLSIKFHSFIPYPTYIHVYCHLLNTCMYPSPPDLHSELSRKNTTPENEGVETSAEPMVTSNSIPSTHPSTTSFQHTPLIRTNKTPQGTPLHTTFSGTQNFTPSTRISALNMVGDLLRKVGVSYGNHVC